MSETYIARVSGSPCHPRVFKMSPGENIYSIARRYLDEIAPIEEWSRDRYADGFNLCIQTPSGEVWRVAVECLWKPELHLSAATWVQGNFWND